MAPMTVPPAARTEPLLAVRGLQVEFGSVRNPVRVVDGADLEIRPGETRALVGESGSGKTVTALSIMGLLPRGHAGITGGEIEFAGRRLDQASRRELLDVRGRDIAMIFQEPMTSLNPAFTVGDQISEVVRRHKGLSRKAAWARAVEMLDLVGTPAPARRAKEYPHSFSGGMRQRVMIAMAIACEPKLLIADEPTTALDVTIQAGILELLRSLRERMGMAVLLVTHDLGVVADFCDEVTVMYAGQTIESGATREIFRSPQHPYTGGLLASMPQAAHLGQDLVVVPGLVPRPEHMPRGCRFHPRCPHRQPGICDDGAIDLLQVQPARMSRCARVQRGELADPASGFTPTAPANPGEAS
jgi:oligopeptide/dipeptide ABC transporter ATP-binding protein